MWNVRKSRELSMRKSFAAIVCTSVLALPAFNLGMVIASLPAQAGLYNSMVVFGDSLSDSGNAAALGAYAAFGRSFAC